MPSSAQTGFFGTAACLDWPDISFILYSATFCFSCLVFLDNVSLQTITSTPTHPLLFLPLHLIPHSSHPHSYLLYHLCVPRGMAGSVACTLVFSFFFRLAPLTGRLSVQQPGKCDLKTPNSLAGLGNVFIHVDVSAPWGLMQARVPTLVCESDLYISTM